MCRINWSEGAGGSHFYNDIYLRLFCMYGTHFYSGPIGMFCSIITIYVLFKRLFFHQFSKYGLNIAVYKSH